MAERDRSAAGSVLAFMALVLGCAALLAATAALTTERIDENRARRFQRTLTVLTGSAALAANLEWQDDVAVLCDGRALLRGAAAGYGGAIDWLAAARLDRPPTLAKLRITAHQETPGIADFLDTPDQGWLASLTGGDAERIGRADGVSGATITTRAMKRAVATALRRAGLTAPVCSS